MELVIRGYGMKKVLFLIFGFSLFFSATSLRAQESNISTRKYDRIDEQLAYNAIKKIFVTNNNTTIVDTTWSALHISKRATTGYIDIDVYVDNILLTTDYFSDTDSKEMKLEIFSSIDDGNSYVSSDGFLHTLLWNRVEYALGIQDEWIECIYSLSGLFYYRHPLCLVDKEKIRP